MSYELEEVRQHHINERRTKQIEEVLEFAARKGVTLVELETLAQSYLGRKEEVVEGLNKIRRRQNHHKRALNANRVRWQKAKAFLEGHTPKAERLNEQVKQVGSMVSLLDGVPIPQPEPPLIPVGDIL